LSLRKAVESGISNTSNSTITGRINLVKTSNHVNLTLISNRLVAP
jgi:hypothetical protein